MDQIELPIAGDTVASAARIERIPIVDGDLTYIHNLLPPAFAARLYEKLLTGVDWRQDWIRIAGRSVAVPRLQAWFGQTRAEYGYSGLKLKPNPWTDELRDLKKFIERQSGRQFNAVLLNRYRDGRDSVAWHSDDETELGANPVIASFSLGAARRFVLRPKKDKLPKIEILLEHNTLLLMAGSTQRHWQHCLPKTSAPVGERINLTFRQVRLSHRPDCPPGEG